MSKSSLPQIDFAQAIEKQQSSAYHVVLELALDEFQWRYLSYFL